jgi:hypothetical protein
MNTISEENNSVLLICFSVINSLDSDDIAFRVSEYTSYFHYNDVLANQKRINICNFHLVDQYMSLDVHMVFAACTRPLLYDGQDLLINKNLLCFLVFNNIFLHVKFDAKIFE